MHAPTSIKKRAALPSMVSGVTQDACNNPVSRKLDFTMAKNEDKNAVETNKRVAYDAAIDRDFGLSPLLPIDMNK